MRAWTGVFAVVALLGAGAVEAADATATAQRLTLEPAVQDVAPGDVVTVTVLYDATDNTLPGVVLRLHYDSSKLAFVESRLLFTMASMGHQDQPDAGSAYAARYDDGNPETDRRYLATWSHFSAAWPGAGTPLPLPLLEVRFRVLDGSGATNLTLTGTACGDCRLEVEGATIQVVGGGLTQAPNSPTAIPAAPTPTTTPTPGLPDPLGPPPDGDIVPYGRVEPVGIPTLSEVGSLLLGALLAVSAVAILLRRRD